MQVLHSSVSSRQPITSHLSTSLKLKMRTLNTTPPPSSTPNSLARVPHSSWHSPVPYLVGGLEAMLGLIAFALLIITCSYLKLSGNFDNEEDNERDLENGDEKKGDGSLKAPPVYEEKFVVIMAGDEKGTYLATPMSSRASSFASSSGGETYVTKAEKPKLDNLQQEQQAEDNISSDQIQSTQITYDN